MYLFCSISCTPNKDLLQSFNTTNSTKRIYAKMFGFRFSNSEYITIQCEVGIFPPSNSKKVNSDSVVICSCNNLKGDICELTSYIHVNISKTFFAGTM